MPDRFLITGGAGFIGSHLVRRIVRSGGLVRVVDNLSTGNLERLHDSRNSIEFVDGDLVDPAVAEAVVTKIDYVLHEAAIPSVQRSILDPIATNRSNASATLNLLEACRQARVRRFVYAASSSAYGDADVLPKVEDMPPNPLSPYALQKWVGERYCKLYHDLYGLETVSLRYFNIFGPGQDPYSEYSAVIPIFTRKLLSREPLTVFGTGEQSRDFTYIDNVVEANMLALRAKHANGSVCNVGCGERVTLNALIELLERITGLRAEVVYAPAKPGDVQHSLADITRSRKLLGYAPTVRIEDGLSRTVAALSQAILK